MSTAAIDQAKAVRDGESLDTQAVTDWLRSQGHDLHGTPELTQYSGGASNWTYRLKYENADLILRRPPKGTKAKSAHDMGREFKVQSALKPVYPYVPDMVALCKDDTVIGSEFYVMQRIEGIIPRRSLPKGLNLTPSQTRTLCENVLGKLVELHQVDVKKAGLESLGKGVGYTRRQVDGWCDRYEKVITWNVTGFHRVRQWLKDHCPEDVATCVIHNDWRFDNVILNPTHPTEVIGVLDWEMATLGDPLMDLGSMMAYWVQANDPYLMKMTQRQPTHLPGMFTRAEVVRFYEEKTGLRIENWVFYEVFGLFRLAVIAQQIYYRYHLKQTRNTAFKNLWILVNYFDWRCKGLIRTHGM